MKLHIRLLLLTVLSVCISSLISAQEADHLRALEQKVVVMVNAAYDLVLAHSDNMDLIQKALETDPRFIDRENELYIFIHTYNKEKKEVICCAHGIRLDLIGKNMWSLRTPTGRLLFHELIGLIEDDGEGWLEYDWLNPFTDNLQTKYSYVKEIVLKDGRTAWVGCGIWK